MSAHWIAAFVALWLVVLTASIVLLGFLRRVAAVLERAEQAVSAGQVNLGGARVGMEIEQFRVVDAAGAEIESDELFSSPAVYLLLHSGCEPCRRLVARMGSLVRAAVPVIAILDDSPAAHEFALPPHVLTLFEQEAAVAEAFRSGGTPQAFAVARGGIVVETLVPGALTDIEHLLRTLTEGGDRKVITDTVVPVS